MHVTKLTSNRPNKIGTKKLINRLNTKSLHNGNHCFKYSKVIDMVDNIFTL